MRIIPDYTNFRDFGDLDIIRNRPALKSWDTSLFIYNLFYTINIKLYSKFLEFLFTTKKWISDKCFN